MKKLRHGFVDEKALMSSSKTLLENPCTFLLAIFNTYIELSQNSTEKKSPKTTINWLFNDIWWYLSIACFNWKIGVFQQTVAKVYHILKKSKPSLDSFFETSWTRASWAINNSITRILVDMGFEPEKNIVFHS